MKSQLALHVMRSNRSWTKTVRQGSAIRAADIWVRPANKINHFKNQKQLSWKYSQNLKSWWKIRITKIKDRLEPISKQI